MGRLILGFYSNREHSAEALRELGRARFRRSALLHRSAGGPIDIHPRGFGRRHRALLAGSIGLVFGALGIPASPQIAIAAGLLGFVLAWLAMKWFGIGLERRVLLQYRPWILPGESLVVVKVSAAEVTGVLALLRSVGHASTFIVRPEEQFPADDTGPLDRREPLTIERLKAHAVELAGSHQTVPPAGKGQRLLAELRESEQILEKIREDLAEATRLEHSITNAAEWLLC